MDNQLITISKLFSERIFRIPDYQRGYAWYNKQLIEFWDDLELLEKDNNHYYGVLTLEKVADDKVKKWADDKWIIEKRKFEAFYVVDGQQRLTTALILIQCILEKCSNIEALNYTRIDDIKRKFISESKDDFFTRSYIFGYEENNPSFNYLKKEIFNEDKDISLPVQKSLYTNNLNHAKRFFQLKIQDMSLASLEEIYVKVTQQLLINTYTIMNDIDVIISFETMNNRGKPLSTLELLKTRLMYLTTRFKIDNDSKVKLRKTINEAWLIAFNYLGLNAEKPLDDDYFLDMHFRTYFSVEYHEMDGNCYDAKNYSYYFGSYDYSQFLLNKRFHFKCINRKASDDKYIPLKPTDIYNYVNSFKKMVEIWYHINNPFQNDEWDNEERMLIDRVNRIKSQTHDYRDIVPLNLLIYRDVDSKEERKRYLKIIEKLMFISSLVYYGYSWKININEIIYKYGVKKESTKSIIDKLENALKSITSGNELLNNMKKRFKDSDFYSWSKLKYFLYEYDSHLQGKRKEAQHKIIWQDYVDEQQDHETVEHIYPQKAKDVYWVDRFKHLSLRQRRIVCNSLGNLVPLSRAKNSSLQNFSFIVKVESDDRAMGYKFGSYSEIELTCNNDWNIQSIVDRGVKLLGFMEQRWQINLGTYIDKIEILRMSDIPY